MSTIHSEFYDMHGCLLLEGPLYPSSVSNEILSRLNGVNQILQIKRYSVEIRTFGRSRSFEIYNRKYKYAMFAGAYLHGDGETDYLACQRVMYMLNSDNDTHQRGVEASFRAICAPARDSKPCIRGVTLELGTGAKKDSESTSLSEFMVNLAVAIAAKQASKTRS